MPLLAHEMQQDPQQREVSKFGLINRRPQVIRLQRERSEPVQSRTEAPGLKSPCPESLHSGRHRGVCPEVPGCERALFGGQYGYMKRQLLGFLKLEVQTGIE